MRRYRKMCECTPADRMPRKRALAQAFRERLAESTRGRASRSRRKSDAATQKVIADYLPTQKARQ